MRVQHQAQRGAYLAELRQQQVYEQAERDQQQDAPGRDPDDPGQPLFPLRAAVHDLAA